MTKLHLCCGDVYLQGYINMDIDGYVLKRGDKNPNITNLDNYYKDRKIGKKREALLDEKFNILDDWTYANNTISEIVLICSLEHFYFNDAKFIISSFSTISILSLTKSHSFFNSAGTFLLSGKYFLST